MRDALLSVSGRRRLQNVRAERDAVSDPDYDGPRPAGRVGSARRRRSPQHLPGGAPQFSFADVPGFRLSHSVYHDWSSRLIECAGAGVALMNNPFVLEQSSACGRAVASRSELAEDRVPQMYLTALGRPPDAFETQAASISCAEPGTQRRRPGELGRGCACAIQSERVHFHPLGVRFMHCGRYQNAGLTRREYSAHCANGFGAVALAALAGDPRSAQSPSRMPMRQSAQSACAPRGPLSGQGQERHLPVHGRRAVAGRHVRSQAAA